MTDGHELPPALSTAEASVAGNLALFHGVWLDLVAGYHPDGRPMATSPSGQSFPYQQLVYLDFDGRRLTQTNVVLPGRDPSAHPSAHQPHVRTFTGGMVDGVLVFDSAGLASPTIGVSGGPGVLVFLPARVDTPEHARYAEPDWIRYLGGDQRTRTTTLYRDGQLERVLTVSGTRVHPDPSRRLAWDPRGPDGPVHHEETT